MAQDVDQSQNQEEVSDSPDFELLGVTKTNKVVSSTIVRVRFCPEIKNGKTTYPATIVEFTNGTFYMYLGTTLETYEKFRYAESVGKFFHANIKNLPCFKWDLKTRSWNVVDGN